MPDQMTCPVCKHTVERDSYMRHERFVCPQCGWVSWKTRIEMLCEFLDETEHEHLKP